MLIGSALRRSWAGWALIAALAAIGCGGDDSEGGFSPVVSDPLSKVEFLRQADEICVSTESRIEAAADELVTSKRDPKPAEVEKVALGIVVPALESEVAAIGALGAPEGDQAEVSGILDATEAGIAAIESDPRGLVDGPPRELRRAAELARAYGSQECGIR
jgi:hypothetical protein